MSTKTSIKRVALVAVSALGFGLMSVVPASAADPIADSLTVASTSVSATSGATSRVPVTTTFLTDGNDGATRLVALLLSAPAGNIAVPSFETATVSTIADTTTTGDNLAPVRGTSSGSTMITTAATTGKFVRASYNLAFTPVRSGTYTVRVSQEIGTVGTPGTAASFTKSTTGTANAASVTITYTVAAKAEVSPSASTLVASPSSGVATSIGSDTTGVFVLRTVADTTRAEVAVTLSNGNSANALVAADQPAITATTDRGLISWTDAQGSHARTVTLAAGTSLTPTLYVRSDGTSGAGTITFSYVNAAGTTVVIGTEVITFYSTTVATLTVTQNRKIVSTSSGAVLGAAAAATAKSGAVTVAALDSTGNRIPGLTTGIGSTTGWFATSDNTTCVSSTIPSSGVIEGDGSATGSARGNYEINLQRGSAPTSGCAANVTISFYNSATSTITSTSFRVTAGEAEIAKLTLTSDKSSYVPGEKVTLTLNATDSAGNPVADGALVIWGASGSTSAATAPVTPSSALTSNPFGKASGVANTYTFRDGKSSSEVFAPLTSGTVTLTSTLSTSSTDLATALRGTKLDSSFVVGASAAELAADAATDAALEAIDAANAAVDAANQATEAADAATVAAEEARDAADAATAAVEALAADVAKMINEIKAQLKAMSKTIARIARAVR